jgi:hypothetical protein
MGKGGKKQKNKNKQDDSSKNRKSSKSDEGCVLKNEDNSSGTWTISGLVDIGAEKGGKSLEKTGLMSMFALILKI